MIYNYRDFINEVKSAKLNFFRKGEISDLFTASIEIELETDDLTDGEIDYSDEYVNQILVKIRNSVIKQLLRIDNFEVSEEVKRFIDIVLDEVKYEWEDYEYLTDELLDEDSYDEYNKIVIQLIKPEVLSYFYSDDFKYLETQFKNNFLEFYKKYGHVLKFEIDNTLKRGIELSNLSYFNSIDELVNFIEEFYNHYDKQKYWKFTERTGVHINIGLKKVEEYNVIKGLLFLNDSGEDPFVFRNMNWRKNSKFCGSLISELVKDKQIISDSKELLKSGQIFKLENLLNIRLFEILKEKGYKNFGVNLVPLKNFNYIEFRYAGGNLEKGVLIDKLLYFSYIVYLMTNFKYERQEYLKKLYKLLENQK